eukprot:TRINITY_DN4315_c0_g1_i4.p1 TRINITY_DN4315_c0_g1~~TRINITY_DN4315_c0_g1_i4.p1  ORF type:complete len:263 (-),score=25.58 TRINITY_DN4315_c0_g1_i4:1005-1793(-)
MRSEEEGGIRISQSSNSILPITKSGSEIRLIAWNEKNDPQESRSNSNIESFLEIPSNLANVFNLCLVFFVPVICTFGIYLLPFQEPTQGFVNNIWYLIAAPLSQSIFNTFQVYWASICMQTPFKFQPVIVNSILVFVVLSIIAETTNPYPLPVVNPAGMMAVGVVVIPCIYLFSFPRKEWSSKESKEKFGRFNKICNVVNVTFMVCLAFLFAAVLLPEGWRILLTILLHCFIFLAETMGIRISRTETPSPKYHNMFVLFTGD